MHSRARAGRGGAIVNVVVHGYLGVSLTQIWDIVEQDLPDLKRKIEAILLE